MKTNTSEYSPSQRISSQSFFASVTTLKISDSPTGPEAVRLKGNKYWLRCPKATNTTNKDVRHQNLKPQLKE